MPRKLKLVLDDFHLGKGRILPDGSRNPLEDFFFDSQFVEFLEYHSKGEFEGAEIELILNGDFFNHLQLDYREENPDIVSERVALRRTNEILKGHPQLFEALHRFDQVPNHSIMFLLGNHDPGLLFPGVVKRLREVLGEKIQVRTGPYRFDGVHVEHGNQYFADNAYNPERYFLTKGLPEPIVNLPWGSYFVIHLLNQIRRERPYFNKIYPFKFYLRWALIHDTFFALKTIVRILFYFLKIRFIKVPHRRSSLWKTLMIIKEVGLTPRLEREAKRILLTEKETRIVVFGHTHYAVLRQFAPDKVYVNAGLWNDQISLAITQPGKLIRLTYVQLEYDTRGIPHALLMEWKGAHRVTREVDD